jgi:glycosyltransferase involved in cell wall biosynthesis
MKILYSCLSKSWGGMEMFTLTAVKQLLKKNIAVELLCINESRIHIEASNLGLIPHPLKIWGKIHPLGSLKTAALINKNDYDLIHTQASKDLWVLSPALSLIKKDIPLIFTKQMGSYIVKKDILHKWIYKKVTYACAISNAVKRNLIDTCPIDPGRVILLHNGIDTAAFSPLHGNRKKTRNEFSIGEDKILVGMLGRFSPGKGHEEFLSAARELNSKYNNLVFMVVGEASRGENDYELRIKNIAHDFGLENIVFTGFRSDTPEILSAMDIFVFPSHSEAFGIALTEAMAMGIPSVCSDSEGILDIAIDGETSYLFENKNSSDLALKIEKLIVSPEKRIQFGKTSNKRAIEFFALDNLTDKIINIYRKAIEEKVG